MIRLNESFGFVVTQKIPNLYAHPDEDGVDMELVLP
jgi:hypothetical protein